MLCQPLRAHHCRVCNKCVALFDHHCLVVGTCVGEKNHCRFWWLLATQTLELGAALAVVHSGFVAREKHQTSWLKANGDVCLVAASLCLLLAFVASLLGFHSTFAEAWDR